MRVQAASDGRGETLRSALLSPAKFTQINDKQALKDDTVVGRKKGTERETENRKV